MLTLDSALVLLVSLLAFSNAESPGVINFIDPTQHGGSMLANAQDGYGEPLNVIVSGESTSDVLTFNGAINFARAIGFSTKCFGSHLGTPFTANLGDGDGWVNQTLHLRQDYGDAVVGTCLESMIGGVQFRVFPQVGPSAYTRALFLAVSKEEGASENHTIAPDGYNVGRDTLVANAVGTTSYGGVTYSTQVENVSGLLVPGSDGVNHGIAQDGIVTLLTVTIVSQN